jgi:uncharacterized delta-60 repeat protein
MHRWSIGRRNTGGGYRHFVFLGALVASPFALACGAAGPTDDVVESTSASLTPAAGTVDSSFGAKCVDTTAQFTVQSGPRALLQGDKILTAVTAKNGDNTSVYGLVRFTSAGAVDTTFGSRGYARTAFPGNVVTADVRGLAIGSDGKLVVVGAVDTVVTDSTGAMKQPTLFGVARFTSAGALDTSFGQGGKLETSVFGFADRANAVLVQPDGKILVGGQTHPTTPGYRGGDVTALVRYTSSGALDASFGQGGIVTVAGGPTVTALGLELNGNILTAPGMQRFSASGAPISGAFSGTLTQTTPGQFGSVVLQSDGKRVAAGSVRSPVSKHAFFPTISRIAADGTADFTTPGFNYGSSVMNQSAVLQALLVEPSGRIIGGGQANLPSGGEGFGLIAVQAGGSIDATFGNDAVSALLLQSDGKIVAVGYCTQGVALARYIGP